jgi:predicted GH43/DUF377 family glycosyl hydrolase
VSVSVNATPGPIFERLGTVLTPSGASENDGVLNPAGARSKTGELLLFPRDVSTGNVSRIGLCRAQWEGDRVTFERDGFVLEPAAPYERRTEPGGYGCEDPRVTYVAALDRYLMAYCAYGPLGPQVAVATSPDALAWTRLGTVTFRVADRIFGDKDAAFFPEPVMSPAGVPSIALLHRPTFHMSIAAGRDLIPSILNMDPADRESICIGYVPLENARADLRALLCVTEPRTVLAPDGPWGIIKVGAGTPPVRVREGWMLLYHGIDPLPDASKAGTAMQYRAGVVVLDARCPDRVVYRSPEPIMTPETPAELSGVVDHVVFPTAIDPRPDIGERAFDVYYGMADSRIGRGRLTLPDGDLA